MTPSFPLLGCLGSSLGTLCASAHLFACGNSQFVNILEAPTKLTNATTEILCLEECYQKVIYFSTINLTIILLGFSSYVLL